MRLKGAGVFILYLLLLTAVLQGGESISAGFGTVMGGGKRNLASRFEANQVFNFFALNFLSYLAAAVKPALFD